MRKAIIHLKKNDPTLRGIIEAVGPYRMQFLEPTFATLVRSIVYQQLSGRVARVIYQRLLPRKQGGLVAGYEILKGTIAVRNLIRESNTRQLRNAITMGQADGMQTLEMHLSQLVTDGIIERDEAVHRSLFPKEIARPPAVPAAV